MDASDAASPAGRLPAGNRAVEELPWEHNFRDAMVRMRQKQEMTQTDLARILKRDYGLPFHQQTIQRVESGERPVRLNEANIIADVLRVDLATMMSGTGTAMAVRLNLELAISRFTERAPRIYHYLQTEMEVMDRLHSELEGTWEAYEYAQQELGEPVDPELSADMRHYQTRYRRAEKGWHGLQELGDL